MTVHPIRRDERGETLVELLVAIAILGVAGIAVLGSVMLGIKVSDIHRKTTGAAAAVRNYAEDIESYVANTPGTSTRSGGYQPCAGANYYSPSLVGYTSLPTGWTVSQTAAVAVGGGGASMSCTTDSGVQQITVTVTSSDGHGSESLTVILRAPCSYRWSDTSPKSSGACGPNGVNL